MNSSRVQAIVNAVLYAGYMLYPYRPSSVKNRQRWTFGGVYPKDYSEAECGAEPWVMQTQCLLQARADTVLDISTGFLQLVQRRAGELLQPLRTWPPPAEPEYREVEVLEIGERRFTTWQEAMAQFRCAIDDLITALRRTILVLEVAAPSRFASANRPSGLHKLATSLTM